MSLTIPSSIAEIIQITKPLGHNGADAADDADDTRPILIIDTGDLPRVARQLRDIIANSGQFFDRGGPARISWQASEMCASIFMALSGLRTSSAVRSTWKANSLRCPNVWPRYTSI